MMLPSTNAIEPAFSAAKFDPQRMCQRDLIDLSMSGQGIR